MKQINIKRAFAIGWEGTKNNWPVLLGLFALYVAASVVQNILQEMLSSLSLATIVTWFLSIAVNILLSMLLSKFGLQIALQKGGRAASFGDLELGTDEVGRYFAVSFIPMAVVFGLLVVLAVVLVGATGVSLGLNVLQDKDALKALLPTLGGALLGALAALAAMFIGLVYLSLIFAFARLAVLHQGLGPMEAFRESRRLTQGVLGDVFVSFTAIFAACLAGLLCLCVGIIPAAMVISIAWPAIYLDVLDQSGPRV